MCVAFRTNESPLRDPNILVQHIIFEKPRDIFYGTDMCLCDSFIQNTVILFRSNAALGHHTCGRPMERPPTPHFNAPRPPTSMLTRCGGHATHLSCSAGIQAAVNTPTLKKGVRGSSQNVPMFGKPHTALGYANTHNVLPAPDRLAETHHPVKKLRQPRLARAHRRKAWARTLRSKQACETRNMHITQKPIPGMKSAVSKSHPELRKRAAFPKLDACHP